MNCPVCEQSQLVMLERQGIEIDYCPSCRGVWLDRGELDKLIERSTGASPAAQPVSPSHAPQAYAQQMGGRPYYKKKREGFLADLFDFD